MATGAKLLELKLPHLRLGSDVILVGEIRREETA